MTYDGFYGAYKDGELRAISNSRWHIVRWCNKNGCKMLPMLLWQFCEKKRECKVPQIAVNYIW